MGKFDDMELTGFGDTVILVAGSLYVKTETAMQTLIEELKTIGYDVELSKSNTDYWFANLSDISRGKCGSCNELISVYGIRSHGHKCEKCGEVTYWQILDGTIVRFSFTDSDGRSSEGMTDVRMTVKRWDHEAGWIYFYPKVERGIWGNDESAQTYFDAYSSNWEEVEEDGEKLIKMRYTQTWDPCECAFNPSEITGPYDGLVERYNHTIVRVWQGKEYGEWDGDFPLPDSINCHGRWKQPLLEASPTIHNTILQAAGQVADKGWHYQDGRSFFVKDHWRHMSTFIRHFTKLDADAFDKSWPHFRTDGPGGIDDLAAWCHPDAVATDEPNIGSLIIGFSKVASGQRLAPGEVSAMKKATADPETFDTFTDVMTGGRRKAKVH